jgi:hypothetical protein
MRIHNIYSDEDGETHFRDIDIDMSQTGPDGTTSKRLPATGVYFRTTPADWFFDWHPATRRQSVINLDAPNQITARRMSKAGLTIPKWICRSCSAVNFVGKPIIVLGRH